MTVFIMDLDWMFDKSEIPNINCMRISSFHKQFGHSVYLINDMSELTMSYDVLYIWGESDSIPTVGRKILNDKRTKLFGKRFEFCGRQHIGSVIAACRPDYLLYQVDEKSSYAKANFITFFNTNGTKIEKRQEWHNTKKGLKRTIITDEHLWSQNPDDIVQCFNNISEEHNVVFLQPISLKCILTNENVKQAFLKLHFSRATQFKWRNDVGCTLDCAQHIIRFLLQLKQVTKSKLGSVPFKLSMNNFIEDFKLFIQIAAEFKKNKLLCSLPLIVKDKHSAPYMWLKQWIENNAEHSFIEYMLFFKSINKGQRWYEIINNRTNWSEAKIKLLIQLLTREDIQTLLPHMSTQWGTNYIDYSMIDLKQITYYGTMMI